jgi:hypothetical protein
MRVRVIATILACASALAGTARPAAATMSLGRLPLATVTSEAGRIVHATVADVRSGNDAEGTPATWVSFTVKRTVKGAAAGAITVKQFGRSDQAIGRVPGQPSFTKGEELVVFLRPESGRGFTSPVGLADGVYRVSTRGGARTARAADGAAQDLDAFLADVERLVAEQRR